MSSIPSTPLKFNLYTSTPRGVMPRVPLAQADGSEGYELMMNQEVGPRNISFNHVNTNSDETVAVIRGSYSIRLGDPHDRNQQRLYLKEGDVFIIPKNTPHGDIQTESGYRTLQIEKKLPVVNTLA